MRGLNKITLEEFSDTMLFVEELLTKPVEEFNPVLDQILSDYRLAKEMIIVMNELCSTEEGKKYHQLAREHFKVILALWIVLNVPKKIEKSIH